MDTSANHDLLPGKFSDDTVREIVAAQRRFFRTGTTLPVSWRIRQLKPLQRIQVPESIVRYGGERSGYLQLL